MPPLTDLPWGVWVVTAFTFGAVIGSFLNVVIYRLPRDQSLVRPASRCPACEKPIAWWANVPLLSYLALRGRCFHCKARISYRYPAVEALTGLLFAALFVYWGFVPQLAVTWLLCAALIAVIFIDAEHQIIPNAITFPGIPLGLACAWLLPTPPDIVDALFGLFIAGGMMWAIAAAYEWATGRVGLGMGDVKLVAMLGCFLGLQAALGILVIGSFLGLGQALAMIAFRGAGRLTRIPFGPALAVAGVVHLFDPDLLPRMLGQL